ncbi:anti-sigma factor family protein [Streptomyces sp. NPDC029674]|uniref:anti-sigma factor family protein n=1 Tax=Streptomyces sp. NPDC029674 TaxID=3365297 RepID=UPI0038516A32
MTTATDSDGHPDVAEISDLTEGLLSPSRTSDVRRHLDSCELCTDVYASLEEIRGMLGTLPGPPRMPDDVAGRIDAALAAEALLDSTAPEGLSSETAVSEPVTVAASPSTPTSTPGPARVSRETTSASASSRSADRPAGHARAATGPGRGGRLRATRRRTTVLGAVFTAAAIGLGTLLIQTMGGDSGGTAGTPPEHRDTANSFSEGKLKGRVADLLEKNAPHETGGKSDTSPPSFDIRNSPESPKKSADTKRAVQVPDCIQRGIGDKTPLAAEEGSYEGKRAYLVVVPHDSDSTKVSAYVVDAACVGKSSPAAGKVLVTHSYPQN